MTRPAGSTERLVSEARDLDISSDSGAFRDRFDMPHDADGSALVYLCGNSLGPCPTASADLLREALDSWRERAVEGHFEGNRPWLPYHEPLSAPLARLAGAHEDEVVATGTLTANIHSLLASFYRPTGTRTKLLIEPDAFPSDRYAAATQIAWHNLDPERELVIARSPEPGETITDTLIEAIAANDEKLCTVLVAGVHFLTGELLDIARLTQAAHQVGARIVVDLAHAMGNVPLDLHAQQVDAAAWCSYKYMNSGPGAIAGLFVHRNNHGIHRLGGWWGNNPENRFEMRREFEPIPGAAGWQVSNAPVFSMAPLHASLPLFDELGNERRQALTNDLWNWTLDALEDQLGDAFHLMTPRAASRHGAQISLAFEHDAQAVAGALRTRGIVCDERPPNVIRVAGAPLYNNYTDMAQFVVGLRETLDELG